MTPQEYNSIPSEKRPDIWVSLSSEEQQAIIDYKLPESSLPKIKVVRPLDGLDTYHPYLPPSSVNLLYGLGGLSIIIGVVLYFTVGGLWYPLTALGAAGSLFLWAMALNYLAQTAHYSRISAAMLWAQRRTGDPK